MKKILGLINKYPRKRVITVCVAVVLVLLLAFLPMITGGNGNGEEYVASVLSGTVEKGSINTSLIGAGTLSEEDALEISLPSGVKLTEFLVSNGDRVKKGDALAGVDRVTVMEAIAEVQDTLDYLREEMEDAKDSDTTDKVIAKAAGKVKTVYAKDGDDVQSVMLEHGALAVLSLDGLMAVEIETKQKLSSGDEVIITFKDGREIDGKVKSYLDGTAIIITEDDDYTAGTKVTAQTEDGTKIGSGKLYIHSQWNATAYSGIIADVKIAENEKISSGEALFSLENVRSTAKYDTLASQHREYEELMLSLFKMYQDTTLNAPADGIVSGVDKESVHLLYASDDAQTELLANAPSGDDSVIYNNYLGKIISVGDSNWNIQLNPDNQNITDYKDLRSVNFNESDMTLSITVNPTTVPVYELSGDNWVQINVADVGAGDIILFAGNGDNSFVWAVRIIKGDAEEPTTEPTATEPSTVPSTNESSTAVSDSTTVPTTPSIPDTTKPSGSDMPSIPSDYGDITIPSGSDMPSIPSDYGDITMPSGSDMPSIPSDYGDITMPSGSDMPSIPSDYGDITMPSGSDMPSIPSDYGDITMPSGFEIPDGSSGQSQFPGYDSFTDGIFTGGAGMMTPSVGLQTVPEFELYDLEGDTVVSVIPQANMTVSVTVDELDISGIKTGQTAEITLDAFLGETFTGTITDIGTTGENAGGNSKFAVEITLEREDNMLSGMNATAKITLGSTTDVLTVPVEALHDNGSETVIYTKYDKGNNILGKPVVVEVGVSDGITAEIVSGLNEGDEYYYSYYDTYQSSDEGSAGFGGFGRGGMSSGR